MGVLLAAALDGSAVARPGSGYGDLIDNYCIDRGRLRARAHQGHCAACHHQGTFDTAPQHRVEPNWTEFERGRSAGAFDFFCPGVPASAQVQSPVPPGTRPPVGPSKMPQTPRGTGPMGMPPVVPAEPAPLQAAPPVTPGQTVTAPTAEQPQPPIKPEVQSTPQITMAELTGRLTTLHDTVGIKPGQEPAWREFIDAMAAATPRERTAPGSAEPTARLKVRERELSERIVALRAVGTALSRLGALLDATQRRSLSDGVAPLLDAM